MTQHKIFLRHDEVEKFVNMANRCDFDVDIAYNHYVVDAKSILGVFGLDFSQALTVTCNGFNEEFEGYLHRFSLAC